MKKIYISDYTLRQTAASGSAVSFREKANIAKCLDELGVDAIELAAIKSGKEDCIINRTIATAVKNAAVAIPAGFSTEEIDMAWDCVKDAAKPILQVIVPTSRADGVHPSHQGRQDGRKGRSACGLRAQQVPQRGIRRT